MKRIVTVHRLRSPKIQTPLRLAVAADLHSAPYDDVLDTLTACDAVLLPGDLVNRHRGNNELAKRFLMEVPRKVPVFYTPGNHEQKFPKHAAWEQWVSESRAVLLDNASCSFRGIEIGGLSSPAPDLIPDLDFLDGFEKKEGFRLLMCHHPETARDYVWGRNIDFTVCGHAHGGQIQLFGRGLYAPGQGLFPRLTHGLHDGGKTLISRGMTNAASPRLPRINNPCELIVLELEGTQNDK